MIIKSLNEIKKGIVKASMSVDKQKTNFALSILNTDRASKLTDVFDDVFYADIKSKENSLDAYFSKLQKKAGPTIFFIHGGSFVGGDKFGYRYFAKDWCEQGYNFININYRLIPKVNFNDLLDDVKKAINFSLLKFETKIDNEKIFFMGDSAGATIASLITAQVLNGEFIPSKKIKIIANCFYYGGFDYANMKGLILKAMTRIVVLEHPNLDKSSAIKKFNETFSTIKKLTKNYPPTFITCGDKDSISHQSKILEKRLKELKVKVCTAFWAEMNKGAVHGFLNLNNKVAKATFYLVCDFFDLQLRKNKQINKKKKN